MLRISSAARGSTLTRSRGMEDLVDFFEQVFATDRLAAALRFFGCGSPRVEDTQMLLVEVGIRFPGSSLVCRKREVGARPGNLGIRRPYRARFPTPKPAPLRASGIIAIIAQPVFTPPPSELSATP
jgi:hypothetical protein